jgi:uncharacterized RDD family membrane protein YckC
MAVLRVPTNFNIDVEFEIPEFYKRLIALLIDVVIQYFYLRIANQVYNSIAENYGLDVDSMYDLSALRLLFWVPIMIYHPLMEITMNGQSIGKKIVGIRVVNENGGRPSISQYLIRWLLRISDVWIAVLILLVIALPLLAKDMELTFIIISASAFLLTDIALVVSSKKGQRIGDMLARTILIDTRTKGNIEETVFEEVADSYVPSFPQIMQLSDRDINAIKSILATAKKKGDEGMAYAAASKVQTHLRIETTMEAFQFLETVMKDYNYLSAK